MSTYTYYIYIIDYVYIYIAQTVHCLFNPSIKLWVAETKC